ncbi:hypothetical protein AB0F52_10025 [Amycolatopsis sp. NPDC024027]|uniref:hypothetical protein n=1 Tax=Amycolatopsis sp. NPDC024027 TaxID=3154327 RepID=UPI00340138B4
MSAVAAAELPIMHAYGEALAGTGKPLVVAGSIGSPGNLGRPIVEEDPALPGGDEHQGALRARNAVERAVIDLAERGVRSSVVRIANIVHDTTDDAGFLPLLLALAKEKGFAGHPGDGTNLWNAVHVRDLASPFRLALEKGPAGSYWHDDVATLEDFVRGGEGALAMVDENAVWREAESCPGVGNGEGRTGSHA